MRRQSILAVFALAAVLTGPARAEDGGLVLPSKPCNLACKLWRTVSGNAQVSFEGPVPSEVRHDPPAPRPEDGAYAPRIDELVAVHGEVIKKTAAERAQDKRQLAAMMTIPEQPAPEPLRKSGGH